MFSEGKRKVQLFSFLKGNFALLWALFTDPFPDWSYLYIRRRENKFSEGEKYGLQKNTDDTTAWGRVLLTGPFLDLKQNQENN